MLSNREKFRDHAHCVSLFLGLRMTQDRVGQIQKERRRVYRCEICDAVLYGTANLQWHWKIAHDCVVDHEGQILKTLAL